MQNMGGSNGWADADAMHRLIAGRSDRGSTHVDWREARDLTLLLTLATATPLAILALETGTAPLLACALTAITAAAGCAMVRVYRRDYALDLLAAGTSFRAPTIRWRSAVLRLIPARHVGAGSTKPSRAFASSGRAPGSLSRRPGRPRSGG